MADETGSARDHRYHFARKRSADRRKLMADEMAIGMYDQCSRAADESSHLAALIEFARERSLQSALLSYLERVRGFSESRLASVRDRLGSAPGEVVRLESKRTPS